MILTDTHSHLYLKEFRNDLDQVIRNAIEKDVRYILLPNIDSSSLNKMHEVCDRYPGTCFPMIGLHPTSVKANYKDELTIVEKQVGKHEYVGIGEIGIDLYWDRSFEHEQEEAFRQQVNLARSRDLPIVIHSRNSIDKIIAIIDEMSYPDLKGVFHCFSGNKSQAEKIVSMGFLLGIGGVVTFKNSGLQNIVKEVDLSKILLETDAPFLAPVPYRGKRNESAYIRIIAEKIAEIKNTDIETVAAETTNNAIELFKIEGLNF